MPDGWYAYVVLKIMLLVSLQVLSSQHLIYLGEHRTTIYQKALLSTCCRCFVFLFFFQSSSVEIYGFWFLFIVTLSKSVCFPIDFMAAKSFYPVCLLQKSD